MSYIPQLYYLLANLKTRMFNVLLSLLTSKFGAMSTKFEVTTQKSVAPVTFVKVPIRGFDNRPTIC